MTLWRFRVFRVFRAFVFTRRSSHSPQLTRAPMTNRKHKATVPAAQSTATVSIARESDQPANTLFLADLIKSGRLVRFDKGALLLREGEGGGDVFVIQSGAVRVFAADEAGRQVIIDEHGAGDLVGEMSMDGTLRSASVMAIELTETVVVSRNVLRDYIAARPDFALSLIVELSRRAKRATYQLKSLALKDVYGRLSDTLMSMSDDIDGARLIPGRLNKSELARRVGASRDMVTLIIKDLIDGGYIVQRKNDVLIARALPARW